MAGGNAEPGTRLAHCSGCRTKLRSFKAIGNITAKNEPLSYTKATPGRVEGAAPNDYALRHHHPTITRSSKGVEK